MTIEEQITRSPIPYDAEKGAAAVQCFGDFGPRTRDLIAGAAGCSPYLDTLIERHADWLTQALDAPDKALQDVHERSRQTEAKALPGQLRQAKQQVALLTGLADLGGLWSLGQVTGALTEFADLAVTLALRATIAAEIARGKLPGMGEADVAGGGGMTVLAMGKMGAHELNYSSDIDLICLFDETRFQPDDFHDARASFVRATRRMSAMLNDLTGDGYVFRTDLRLRPDPAVTPVCMAMEAAERYYESLGRTWERAAYIKARPCAGDLAAGARFLETLTPFVWRKHLDFAAIQDAHDMRLRYREYKGTGGAIKLLGHNMKLGRGGIREIEFFTQTRQIIAGGRDPELRLRGTQDSLAVLAQKEWVPERTAQVLSGHYVAHREVEHRLQMLRDAQTHSLPKTEDEFDRLAAFMGKETRALKAEIKDQLTEVHDLTEGFFAPDAAPEPAVHSFDPAIIDRWKSYPALRSERGAQIFARLRPDVLRRLAETPRPDEALLAFDGFLAGLPAGVQLFSLFEANPQLIDLLVDIVGTAPALSRYLSRNAGVFDAVIAGGFFNEWRGVQTLTDDLAEILDAEDDYERKLDSARRWAKEWQFGIGVHHLRGLIDAAKAGARYADLAEASLRALWPHVCGHFAQKHGGLPGRGAIILGMGSLGAGRLNATSDLDLIMIYDAAGEEMSDGRRPLPVRQYYARLTQAMVTAMTAPMAEGRLYEVDMRLRPSGTQGPVATSWQSFSDYQKNQAWLWEHLALTRARVIAGTDALAADVEALRCAVIARKRAAGEILGEVAQMRGRIRAAKAGTLWDAKIGPGRLQEIELIGQAGLLGKGAVARDIPSGIEACAALGWISDADRQALIVSHQLFATLQTASRLLSETVFDEASMPGVIGQGGLALLLREMGATDMTDLIDQITRCAAQADSAIGSALSAAGEGM
ncbi:MAG: glutamine-synthetase adenylyltransferase [Pseudomonadota bacterium]